MLRKIIFKDTVTGEELVMPVSPKGYQVEHGRKANSLTLYETGDINLPGSKVVLDEELEFLLPAREYPFNEPGTVLNPFYYLEKLERWSDAGRVLRFIVSGTPVNAAVLLDPIRYREEDGSNDIYVVVPLRGYRALTAPTTESLSTQNSARAVEAEPERQRSYTVVRGDTLSGICRRFYGDASAAMVAKVAAYNGIQNVNLIYPGQVLSLPGAAELPAAKAKSNPPAAGTAKETAETASTGTTEMCKLKIFYTGWPYGACRVTWGEGKTASMDYKAGNTRLTVLAPAGSRMRLSWFDRPGAKWAYAIIRGVSVYRSQREKSEWTLTLAEDSEVYIHWVKENGSSSLSGAGTLRSY